MVQPLVAEQLLNDELSNHGLFSIMVLWLNQGSPWYDHGEPWLDHGMTTMVPSLVLSWNSYTCEFGHNSREVDKWFSKRGSRINDHLFIYVPYFIYQPAADGCSELTALWLCSGEALRKTLAVTVAVSILLQSYLHCVVAPVPKYASNFLVCLLFLV